MSSVTTFNIRHCKKKMKFSMKVFFSKCDQIRRKLRMWSHLLKKSFMENFIFFIFCAARRTLQCVNATRYQVY